MAIKLGAAGYYTLQRVYNFDYFAFSREGKITKGGFMEYIKQAKYILLGILVLLGLILGAMGLYTVDSGEKAVVLKFGAIDRTVGEGLHFKLPLVERVKIYSVRLQKYEAHGAAASKDLQRVDANIAINYLVDGTKVAWVYANMSEDYNMTIIQPNISEVFKAVTARYNAEELITKREIVKGEIAENIKRRMAAYKIVIDNVSITNFTFSAQYAKAIEEKQVAEQEALTATNQLERIKVEAEQKIAMAKAEAESLRLQKSEITPMMVELRRLEVSKAMIDKWKGDGQVVPSTMLGTGQGVILNLK